MNKEITLGRRKISADSPVFVVAELSANHNHDFGRALKSSTLQKKPELTP